MKIVADAYIPFLKGLLDDVAQVVYLSPDNITADAVKDADALIVRTRTHCNASLLSNSKVQFIATATIGFDHIDTEYVEKSGIRWTNAPGCNSASVMFLLLNYLLFLINSKGFIPPLKGLIATANSNGSKPHLRSGSTMS